VIRAEDGRPVRGVDLRPFINHLPLGRSTERFDTDDASGSTSQAANIIEALEAGARTLLIDEDTAATNFMIRDARMRRLVPAADEPITPFLDRVGELARERHVSSVLVMGGAGDYLDVADRVIRMVAYQPVDASEDARRVACELPLGAAAPRPPSPWLPAAPRRPDPASLDPGRTDRRGRVRAHGDRAITFGAEEVDLSSLTQLVEAGQTRMIADVLACWGRAGTLAGRTVGELLDALEADVDTRGLSHVTAAGFGDRTRARRLEIAAVFNRLAALRVF
jgi:predicted ABC-class ATPase